MTISLGQVCNPVGMSPSDPLFSWTAYFNPFCTAATGANSISSINPSDPNSPMNSSVCYGGGAQLDQPACLAAAAAAVDQLATGDPQGAANLACVQSGWLCTLGIVDANGNFNLSLSNPFLLAAGALAFIYWPEEKRGRR